MPVGGSCARLLLGHLAHRTDGADDVRLCGGTDIATSGYF